MRAFTSFLVVLVVVGALGYGGLVFLRDNADKFKQDSLPAKVGKELRPSPPPAPPASGPRDYHLLEGQGGIPRAQAEAAGLATDQWAYLQALTPLQQSEGIANAQDVTVRNQHYDFCLQYAATPAQEQYLEYQLGAKWDELHFGFGFSDLEPSDPSNSLAIELSIAVDGRTVFGPQRFTPVDKPAFAQINVTGANRAFFTSRRIGMQNRFAPILLDPFVKVTAAEPVAEAAAAGTMPESNK